MKKKMTIVLAGIGGIGGAMLAYALTRKGVPAEGEPKQEMPAQETPAQQISSDTPRKAERNSRNERLFGSEAGGVKTVAKNAPVTSANAEGGVKGFLLVQCEACGNTKSFFTKSIINQNRCTNCGHVTPLSLSRTIPAWVACKCSDWEIKYRTNCIKPTITIDCKNCGAPVDLFLNGRGTAYTTGEGKIHKKA